MYILLSILLAVAGAVMICNPRLIYALTESWKHNGTSEPSNLYILNIRIGGCVFAIIGVVGAIVLTLVL